MNNTRAGGRSPREGTPPARASHFTSDPVYFFDPGLVVVAARSRISMTLPAWGVVT
jgi:hypothetical protein